MRFRANASDTWHKIKVKALDGMPVGTIVDYDGQASDIPTGWENYGTGQIKKTSETTPTMASLIGAYSTSTQDGYYCKFINDNFVSKDDNSIKEIFRGSSASGVASTINTTWENIGKFNYLIIELYKSSTNTYSSVIFPYAILCNGNNLNENKYNVNVSQLGYIDSAIIGVHLIPNSNISNNSITFDGYGNDVVVYKIFVQGKNTTD